VRYDKNVGKASWLWTAGTVVVLGALTLAHPSASEGSVTWEKAGIGHMTTTAHMAVTAQDVAVSHHVMTGKGMLTTEQVYVKVDLVLSALDREADWTIEARLGHPWNYEWAEPMELRGAPAQTPAGFTTWSTVVFELTPDQVDSMSVTVIPQPRDAVDPARGVIIATGLKDESLVGLAGAAPVVCEPALTVATR
jgi:hypothetical protein